MTAAKFKIGKLEKLIKEFPFDSSSGSKVAKACNTIAIESALEALKHVFNPWGAGPKLTLDLRNGRIFLIIWIEHGDDGYEGASIEIDLEATIMSEFNVLRMNEERSLMEETEAALLSIAKKISDLNK